MDNDTNQPPASLAAMLEQLLNSDPAVISKTVEQMEREWQQAAADMARSKTGRRWLKLALARYNVTGSVFDNTWDAKAAAFRDGRRSVISDLLNATAKNSQSEIED